MIDDGSQPAPRPPGRATAARMGLLGALYFSQGLPFGFFTQSLPALLRQQGYSLGAIGLTSLLAAPWALKFLWAPVVDRHALPGLGRRKSWIVPLQLASVAILATLAAVGPGRSMPILMTGVLLLNLAAATQDIATDGLAVELLPPGERGLANGIQVGGYRAGMVAGGGILLVLHHQLGTGGALAVMAGLTALATIPAALMHEPHEPPPSAADPAAPAAALHFLRRPGAVQVLLLLVTYKLGEAFASGMLRPFLIDSGLDLEDLGWLLGTGGFVAGLVGALCGGALLNRIGRRQALVGFGVLQAATVAGYAFLAFTHAGLPALIGVVLAEHLASGMATVALFTCMMDWCTRASSGTDYTVQASAVVIATGVAGALAGFSAQALGYGGHFALATVLALAALAAVRAGFPSPATIAALRGDPG